MHFSRKPEPPNLQCIHVISQMDLHQALTDLCF